MKNQLDCVLNVLEELGDKQLFLKYQSSTDIFFLILLLLPSMFSNNRETNKELVGIDSEDVLQFSRIELLRLLLNAHVVSDEEDTSLSSILHTRRMNISL